MHIKSISPFLSVSEQIRPEDVETIAEQGFKAVINNRPDHESDDQPATEDIRAEVEKHGLEWRHMPVVAGSLEDSNVAAFAAAMEELPGPVLAYCRTGTRSASLWALHAATHLDVHAVLGTTAEAGYDLSGLTPRMRAMASAGADVKIPGEVSSRTYDVLVVGGGSAGIAAVASIMRRKKGLRIAIIEPREEHYYQPGFTLVGGGAFKQSDVVSTTEKVMPPGVKWIHKAAAAFEPEANRLVLEDGTRLQYRQLIVAPGIKLDWDAVGGLTDTLGHNGVTSNYRYELTAYTWKLVSELKRGRALFTQPPMPIKCAGAPQKAMYLSCDHWLRLGRLADIDVGFYNAGGVLFGVDAYVPALMEYVKKYDADLNFMHNLVEIDGSAKTAWFDVADGDTTSRRAVEFDMIHVCPPQTAPDFVSQSPLADKAGWVDVHPDTLQHRRYENIFGLGDATNTPNAKTMAAVRKQAPVVASNIVDALSGRQIHTAYDGYGSCPLTVERGKVVLAEFGYGGKLLPTFPKWLNDGTRPTRFAWLLKESLLPPIYYQLVLKGREWLVRTDEVEAPEAVEAGSG